MEDSSMPRNHTTGQIDEDSPIQRMVPASQDSWSGRKVILVSVLISVAHPVLLLLIRQTTWVCLSTLYRHSTILYNSLQTNKMGFLMNILFKGLPCSPPWPNMLPPRQGSSQSQSFGSACQNPGPNAVSISSASSSSFDVPASDISDFDIVSPDVRQNIITVSDHRTKQPGKAVQQTPKLSMKDSDLQELLDTSFSLALTDIISCPIRNSSSRGQGIISLANAVEHNSASKQDLIKVIKPEFINIITASELNTNTDLNVNERLFNEFYQFTTNKTVKTEMTNIILKLNNATSQPPIKQFLAILQDAVITNFIQERSKLYNKKADEPSQVSDTDQSVLFYIAGYIINALKKQTKRQKTDKQKQLQIQIDNIISNDQSSTKTFVKKHAEWTRKLDRGGLTIPGDNFFLLIREFEICYRKHVDINSITALSLDKPKLISIILDDFMVNYYWDNLCTSDNKEFLLEKCIHLFLSIRGHSTARHIKLRLQEKKDAAAKKPLRQSLKDISN